MELNEFISETIKNIIDGVVEAQNYAKDKGAKINPAGISLHSSNGNSTVYYTNDYHLFVQTVKFNIALTVVDENSEKGKVGIFAGPLKIGHNINSKESDKSVSSIEFEIPVFLPNQ